MFAAALTASGCEYLPQNTSALAPQDGRLRLLDRNPWAARQRSTAGKRIQAVEYAGGRVYVGFGDWRANTGPIAVTSWDLDKGEWTWHFNAATEAIERYRVLTTSIVVPFADPKGAADYAQGPEWRAARAGEGLREVFYHVFDAAETPAGLFLIGTRRNVGEALVRHWDGTSWEDSLLLEDGADWLWFGAVLNGELWVQSERQGAYRFDGKAWWPAERLFLNPRVRSLVSVGNRVAAISREGGPGHLQTSDGRTSTFDPVPDAWDLNVDEESGWVYLLREDRVERSRDLLEWERVPVPVPPEASAIDAAGERLWIGTRDSRLWMVEVRGE